MSQPDNSSATLAPTGEAAGTPALAAPPATSSVPLPADGAGSFVWWKEQLDWSKDVIDTQLPAWRYHVDAYRAELKPPRKEGVRVNIEFEKTEQKRSQLFFRLPDFRLKPTPRTIRDATLQTPDDPAAASQSLRRAISIFREFLRHLVGPRRANLKAAMREVVFDVLCPSGIGAIKVGYERFTDGTRQIATGQKIPDPTFTQPGAVLGIAGVAAEPPLIDETMPMPNVVADDYYGARISPPNLIIPPYFRGSDYNKADYLGHWFDLTKADMLRRGWTVPEGTSTTKLGGTDETRLVKLPRASQGTDKVRCAELFFYPQRLNGSVAHPDRIYRIVIAEGATVPVFHGPYKDQEFDANGRFVRGLRLLPIKVLTLRYVSDWPYPPSDCKVTRSLGDELSEFRTQTIVHRRRAVPLIGIDINSLLDEKVKERLIKGEPEYSDRLPFNGPPEKSVVELARATYPTENRVAADMIMSDVNRMWALGANQSAVTESGATTATEIQSIAQATANRLGNESGEVVGLFLAVLEAFAGLAQLYADRNEYVEVVGPQGAKMIEEFTRADVQGEFLFEAVPDSSLAPDAKADRDDALNFHNLVANNPFFDPLQEARALAEAYGRDPDLVVHQPPKPEPEKPKINLAINGKDLDPAAPQYQNVVNVLIASGIPAAQIAPAAPPPGDITPANVVDRERLRMTQADNADHRGGGLSGPPA